jgi:thiol:disulfide interchange protein DsbC
MRLKLFIFTIFFYFSSGMAMAEDAALKKSVQSHFPDNKIESLRQTPFLGLYEIVIGNEIFYTDKNAEHFFFGHIIDTKTRASLTSQRMQEIMQARRIPLDSLPLEFAIKTVKGNGERTLVVFTDPHCPYCKKLEKDLVDVTDVTIYTLLYPVLNGSVKRATEIWCSNDRLKAWDDFMLRDIEPTGKDCETPISTLIQVGQKNNVSGTPTLVFADGSFVGGLIPADQIEEKMNAAMQKN